MKGFTLIELLMGIAFFTPLQMGFMEGSQAGTIGALIGIFTGLFIAVLWALVWFYWQRRNWEKIISRRGYSAAYILGTFVAIVGLPVVSMIITHQLTVPFTTNFHGH